VRRLEPGELRWTLEDPERLRHALKKPLTGDGSHGIIGQEDALAALELGVGVRSRGFNLFVTGEPGTGRTTTLLSVLRERAKDEPTPPDAVLLYNFADRYRPHAVQVPAGEAPRLARLYDDLTEQILTELDRAFNSPAFLDRKRRVLERRQRKSEAILEALETDARSAGLVLIRTGTGVTLVPAADSGEPMGEDELAELTPEQRREIEEGAAPIKKRIEAAVPKLRTLELEARRALSRQAETVARMVIEPLVAAAQAECREMPRVIAHLEALGEDMLMRMDKLLLVTSASAGPTEEGAEEEPLAITRRLPVDDEEDPEHPQQVLVRYRVAILVTRQRGSGAPVIRETHPSTAHLIGRIEHRLVGGQTVTDFTRIRAGALYRANGGYLVLEVQELLGEENAWEGLKRALRCREIELDDPGEPGRMVGLASLRPEPLPLDLTVCLIGRPAHYHALSRGEPDFSKLFKVKVDFHDRIERTDERVVRYARWLAGTAARAGGVPLTLDGAARVIEHAARRASHQDRLSTRFGELADLVREAQFWAEREAADEVSAHHVRTALEERRRREGYLERRLREDIAAGRIRVELDGEVVGQVNGLTVLRLGRYGFGLPSRITCSVGAGRGELIDVEREVELGGPIHTKGTFILQGFLRGSFGREAPLSLAATLCMEQSYVDIDGDSASLAEACALLSALAGLPVRQRFGVTGSIDQRGGVQAVGGVDLKVEGLCRLWREIGGEATCAAVIPASNAGDLMLDEDVVEACAAGRFAVHAVTSIGQAMELLTGHPWGGVRAAVLDALAHLHALRLEAQRTTGAAGGGRLLVSRQNRA
jgi:predicted ATP-dependent protease